MTTHTPGPWHAFHQGTQHLVSQACDEEFKFAIAKVWEQNYHPDGFLAARNEAEANCALIAAAPDLLAALQSLADAYDSLLDAYGKPHGWGKIESENARAAIARATAA